jgi:ABC-type lipoprotein export system ATPase subunit
MAIKPSRHPFFTQQRFFNLSKVQTITIHDLVPEPIADIASRSSEIWFGDYSFTRGSHYLISAESGTGKSSFFDFLYGRRKDFFGAISYDGTSVGTFNTKKWNEIRQRHISLVFQGFRLFPELTVWENLQLKNQLTGYLDSGRMMQMLETLGIADKRDIPLRFLSYGQQQRVAIIRSLCQPFDFLLLDEPFSHLDETNQQIICRLINDELKQREAGFMLCSLGDPYFFEYDRILKM